VPLAIGDIGLAGEEETINRLKKAGAGVWREPVYGENDSLVVQFINVAGEADLTELVDLSRLRELWLVGLNGTNAGMRTVGRLTGLRGLCLEGSAITDEGLKELKGLRRLRFLTVSSRNVTDVGVKELTRLTKLETLSLTSPGVTDGSIHGLSRLKGLRRLDLRGTGVTMAGAARLKKALPKWGGVHLGKT
jgi:hypothetical protein